MVIGAWSLATLKMATEFGDLVNNTVGTAMLPHPVQFASKDGCAFVASMTFREAAAGLAWSIYAG
ncbi:MAG: hypothetical protein CBARDMAM_0217 [uncultured Caballeronia sp.]|nr:MAG: hypothetical protein CBARDMAM_0217 [uncultured Caballeronia sp.]